ncbi:MAG: GTP-binding protein [Bacteroidia bacterium]|nr:GTP-binding protein [Bacteroidia bacterium]
MNQPIHNDQLNKVLLKPRFKIERNESKDVIIEKFKKEFSSENCIYCTKIIDHHIVIDVPKDEDHFWSPQLHIEVESNEENKTIVKGLFGPKPQVWTFFMFIHFAVAVAFIVFFVVAYTRWNLKQDYTFALIMCIAMPVLWVILYILGQLGKKKGYKQMVQLETFLSIILEG